MFSFRQNTYLKLKNQLYNLKISRYEHFHSIPTFQSNQQNQQNQKNQQNQQNQNNQNNHDIGIIIDVEFYRIVKEIVHQEIQKLNNNIVIGKQLEKKISQIVRNEIEKSSCLKK